MPNTPATMFKLLLWGTALSAVTFTAASALAAGAATVFVAKKIFGR